MTVPSDASFGTASRGGLVTSLDRQLIRELLKEVSKVTDDLTNLAFGRFPVNGSRADQQLNDAVNASSPITSSLVRTAHVSLIFANAAGAEQTRAFVNSVNSKRFSFSLATLTRGALESFAKSHFLLSAADAGELVSRHVSLTSSEMLSAGKHNTFTNQMGVIVDIDAHVRTLKKSLAALNLPLVTGPDVGATRLTTTLLDASADSGKGRQFYSQLSGVAHGESAALGMFLVATAGDVEFRIPRELVVEYAGMLFASCVLVVDRMVEMVGLESEHQARWNAVKVRAQAPLGKLQAMFP